METRQQITSNARAFQLKGSLFTLTVLQLQTTNILTFVDQLKSTVAQSPKFFRNAPVVIDLQKLVDADEPIDFAAICDQLCHQGMIPVGVRGGSDDQHDAAKKHGLGTLHNDRAEKTKPAPISTHQPTKVITQPVRSGQQIYAQHGDLIVLAPVGQGAEVMADGNIHIYAPLRGRALAGVNGDKTARIFCQQLDAELVSIAGYYLAHEDIKTPNQPVQILLEQTTLTMLPV